MRYTPRREVGWAVYRFEMKHGASEAEAEYRVRFMEAMLDKAERMVGENPGLMTEIEADTRAFIRKIATQEDIDAILVEMGATASFPSCAVCGRVAFTCGHAN